MQETKIHFSSTETELMTDVTIILTKNNVLQKIKSLLEQVQNKQLAYIKDSGLWNHPLFTIPPKISKGENYLGLPYIILDYPRLSVPDNLFFIRTFFWWGNFFSSTLQAGGKSKSIIMKKLPEKEEILKAGNYYIGVNLDPWVHHFEET